MRGDRDVDCAAGQVRCLQAGDTTDFLVEEAELIYWGVCLRCQYT